MKKFLLAGAAMLGATAGLAPAYAQDAANMKMMGHPSQGMLIAPWSGGPAANNNNNTEVSPSTYLGPTWAKNTAPAPGTVVIRLNGRVQVQGNAFWTTGNTSAAVAATPAVAGTTLTVGGVTTPLTLATPVGAAVPPGRFKLNPVGISSYMRLYPGVDGMATNGLRYGAALELRTNYYAGVSSGNAALSPSQNSNLSTVFVRRNFVYMAADNVGLIRVGQTDGLGNLFDPGTYTQGGGSFDGGVGTFNGAMLEGIGPTGAVGLPYPWFRDASGDYDAAKVVYLTPQFFGFDAGVEYAPSMGDSSQQSQPFQTNGGASTCTQAGPSCIGLTSGQDGTRWFNKIAAGARWQGVFGPISVGIYGIYTTAGKESVAAPAQQFDNLSEFNVAGGMTYNSPIGSFTGSANYVGGAGNGSAYAMRPKGGADMDALMLALTYRNGPLIVGGAVIQVNSQGSNALLLSQRREQGLAVGASYLVAPGLTVAAEYMYLQRHQGGFDFNTNNVGVGGLTRNARAQGIMIMTAMNW